MSYSKYRTVYGEVQKERFNEMDITQSSSEGSLMAVNTNFLAVSWNSTGGGVAIFKADKPCRCPVHVPLVRGHKSYVVDVKFSPFRSDLLMTASDDSTVKLWEIPEDGITEDMNNELQQYLGHGRKVAFANFNPVCSDIIASASFDNTLHIWNMLKSELITKVSLKEYPTSMEWNYNGSLVACASKDKNLYVVDPRKGEIIVKTKGHESPKTMKMTWIGEYNFISTGFDKGNTREMKLWDIRKVDNNLAIENPAQTVVIDHQSSIPTPYFDYDLKLLFVFGRGEGNMHYYDINDGTIKPCSDYMSSEPTTAIVMFDKKTMDYNKCELDRFAKYTGKNIVYLSFYYPKKVPEFDDSLYPKTFSGESALSLDDWVSGNNAEPVVKDIREIENKWISTPQTFEKKVEEKKPISTCPQCIQYEKTIEELNEKIQELEKENKMLKEKLGE